MNGSNTTPTANRRGFPWMLPVFLAIPFVIGALGALVTVTNVNGWYATTPKVPWTPPNWVFGPVWTLLYILIGVAGWLIWRNREHPAANRGFVFYVTQLIFNALWTPVFFAAYPVLGVTALWFAALIIILLDLSLLATIIQFLKINRLAAVLLLPYLVWVLYATTLNIGDALLAR